MRSLVAGYFSNAARKSSGDVYRVLTRGLLAVGNESKKAPPFARLQVWRSVGEVAERNQSVFLCNQRGMWIV